MLRSSVRMRLSKCSRSLNSPVTIGRDRLAGSVSSKAGTRTCATITPATSLAMAVLNGTQSTDSKRSGVRSSTGKSW